MSETKNSPNTDTDLLTKKITKLIEDSRNNVVTQINCAMVRTYFAIGRTIVENEQNGGSRATYGKGQLKEISRKLTTRFGKGFSVDNLENMRRFYITYSRRISETVSRISEGKKGGLRDRQIRKTVPGASERDAEGSDSRPLPGFVKQVQIPAILNCP